MNDHELTTEERATIEQLPREIPPRGRLQHRVIQSLKDSGLIAHPRRILFAGAIAASILFGFVAGALAFRPASAQSHGREFLLLLHAGAGSAEPEDLEIQRRIGEYTAWAKQLRHDGQLLGADKLKDDVTAIGPAGAGGDPVEGYFRVTAKDPAEAMVIARSSPHLKYGGWIELREIDAR
jgi:hypothetical protein